MMVRRQIDYPATVKQFADQVGCSDATVYNAIKRGFLDIDKKSKRTLIIGGSLPWTSREWSSELVKSTDCLRPGTFGFDGGGNLHILVADKIEVVERGFGACDLAVALKRIADAGKGQLEQAA